MHNIVEIGYHRNKESWRQRNLKYDLQLKHNKRERVILKRLEVNHVVTSNLGDIILELTSFEKYRSAGTTECLNLVQSIVLGL